ncbi:hypothetical protein DFJ73DRAFT_773522 [Zopfochytrium polystomum]|nr:hypothetical protein DFJ73DRAFT_773522 [Zopfochytrium polystomum]
MPQSDDNTERKDSGRGFPTTSLVFVMVWSVAIAKFPAERQKPAADQDGADLLLKYATMDLVSNCMDILLYAADRKKRLAFLYFVYYLTTFIVGWRWFAAANAGYDVVQFKNAFGTGAWLSLPTLLHRVAYFLLWFYLSWKTTTNPPPHPASNPDMSRLTIRTPAGGKGGPPFYERGWLWPAALSNKTTSTTTSGSEDIELGTTK